MKDHNLRLRLVVRRHSLPEVRLLFNINLQDEPTIANLLEQVNETVPLESPDWGLDDYVVEVQDSQGHGFECLHFQPVDTILDRDEELIIRPLFTVDRKKRLLSGREQISVDGRHLVDGVPFGRPRLRAPKGRPLVDIPPLKRRRITANEEEYNIGEEGEDEDEDEDGDYQEDGEDDESEDEPLLLMERGEEAGDAKTVRFSGVFDDADADGDNDEEDEDFIVNEEEDEGLEVEEEEDEYEENMVRVSGVFDDADASPEDDADEENDGDEAREDEDAEMGEDGSDDSDSDSDEDEAEDDGEALDEAELLEELQQLKEDNELLDGGHHELPEEPEVQPRKHKSKSFKQKSMPPASLDTGLDLSTLDKITALRAAFPTAQFSVCEKALQQSDMNEREAYWKLRKSNEARMTTDQMRQHLQVLSAAVQPSTSNVRPSEEDPQDEGAESEAESVNSVVKHYDQHGFPSGSILDGSASKLAAEAMRKSGQDVKIPVHMKFGDEDGDRQPSTQAGKAAPATEEVEDESDTSDTSSSDSDESDSDDSDEDEDDNDEDSDDDSGPEVAPSKPRANSSPRCEGNGRDGSPSDTSSDDDSSSDESDGGSKTHKKAPQSSGEQNTKDDSSDSSSDDDSSDSSSDTSSGSGEQEPEPKQPILSQPPTITTTPATTSADMSPELGTLSGSDSQPGSGNLKTKARNLRRRVAKQAKKAAEAAARFSGTKPADRGPAMAAPVPRSQPRPSASEAEFLVRKKALLAKLASQANESDVPGVRTSPDADTFMLEGQAPASEAQKAMEPETSTTLTGGTSAPASASSSSRRSTLDVGAGRRMLFGALGLRAPKSKADEEKIRADLMKGVRPLANARLMGSSDATDRESTVANQVGHEPEEEDPEAWRDKITYRAVECCQEGVVLSEPPFPFVQRWDPQQQYDNKRGKRKRRDHQEYYDQEYYDGYDNHDNQPNNKKQRNGYDDMESSFMTGADMTDYQEDITLNYDDVPDVPDAPATVLDKNVTDNTLSQFTDADDLPSLPSDLSTLAVLQPGEGKPGMVVTWKQMLVSKATGWAPQVSDLTAVIVQPSVDTDTLRVVLAKRDRGLDGNEKTFDNDGNRVYDRFEAPDMEDDEDSEANVDGYRTIQYTDMMDPRILQQPLLSHQATTLATIEESQVRTTEGVQDEQPSGIVPAALELANNDGHLATLQPDSEKQVAQRAETGTDEAEDSVIPETVLEENNYQRPQSLETEESGVPIGDVSITDDRRRDISLLMHDAGFQDEINPSIAKEPRFSLDNLSSPSRQLEEMSEAAAAVPHKGSRSPVRAPSIHSDASSLRNQMIADSAIDSAAVVYESRASREATPRDATPVVSYPQLPVPSSASSVHSGRQPDPDFTQDWGNDDMLPPIEETGDEAHDASNTRQETESVDKTPTRPARQDTVSLESSPLPSLEEIFSSARSSQAQAKAA